MQALTTIPATLTPTTNQDAQVIAMWVHGRPAATQRAYRADVYRFLSYVAPITLQTCTLAVLQSYADSLGNVKETSKKRMLSAVKSLLTFANKTGYTAVNVGAALMMPKPKETLAERILSEEAVARMLALEEDTRNHALLRLLYVGGLRINEALSLNWRDLQGRKEGGQVTVYGKGSKTRAVILSAATWQELQALPGEHTPDAPVFSSQKHTRLSQPQAWRIVREAAARAKVGNASPHWLRHAHASHALDRGAPISLVSATLGHADLKTTSKYTHARPDHSSSEYLPF